LQGPKKIYLRSDETAGSTSRNRRKSLGAIEGGVKKKGERQGASQRRAGRTFRYPAGEKRLVRCGMIEEVKGPFTPSVPLTIGSTLLQGQKNKASRGQRRVDHSQKHVSLGNF